MSQDLNVVALSGELAQDPELRYTGSGTAICKSRLKVTRHYQNNGEWQSSSDYFDLQAWGETGEQMGNNLREGQRIRVQGSLTLDIWDDQSGDTHYDTEIKVQSFGTEGAEQEHAQPDPQPEPADQRRQNQRGGQQQRGGSNGQRGNSQRGGGQQQETFEPDDGDELPF